MAYVYISVIIDILSTFMQRIMAGTGDEDTSRDTLSHLRGSIPRMKVFIGHHNTDSVAAKS